MELQYPGGGMTVMIVTPAYLHVLEALGLSTNLWEVVRDDMM